MPFSSRNPWKTGLNPAMNDQKPNTGVTGAIQTIDQGDSIKEIREALARARKHLKSMPDDSDPVECARIAGCSRALDRPAY